MAKILETSDYSKFQLYSINRNVKKIKKLTALMSREGWIDAHPAHCVLVDGKLTIKGGHHRFTVAKMLGIPVKYVVCNDTASIYELEQATNEWTMKDHLDSHCESGKSAYIEVRDYCERSGISVTLAVGLLGATGTTSKQLTDKFKTGELTVRSLAHASTVANIVQCMRQCGVPIYNRQSLVRAISRVVKVVGFDAARMKQKIQQYTYLVQAQATAEDYLRMLEEVYNRQVKGERTPLAFLATEAYHNRKTAACN